MSILMSMIPRSGPSDMSVPTSPGLSGYGSESSSKARSPRSHISINDLLNSGPLVRDVSLPSISAELLPVTHDYYNYSYQPSGQRPQSPESVTESDAYHNSSTYSHSSAASSPQPSSYGASAHADRPLYTTEELFFTWYTRDDLGLKWKDVEDRFNRQFHGRPGRQRSGLQCRYYRHLEKYGVPKNRSRARRQQNGVNRYGVIAWTNYRYSWMLEEHQRTPCVRNPSLPIVLPGPTELETAS